MITRNLVKLHGVTFYKSGNLIFHRLGNKISHYLLSAILGSRLKVSDIMRRFYVAQYKECKKVREYHTHKDSPRVMLAKEGRLLLKTDSHRQDCTPTVLCRIEAFAWNSVW